MFTIFSVCLATYSFLYDYAPIIYLDKQEQYFPCSIEYFSKNTYLQSKNNITHTETNVPLKTPSSVQPFFYGKKSSVNPVYAIVLPNITELNPIEALKNPLNHSLFVTYFNFYCYNRGKKFLNTVWDNHVGDIEHSHIYFEKGIPTKIIASYHSFDTVRLWGENMTFYNGTHPILYSARYSHGLWFTPGEHVYHDTPRLADYTSKGLPWYTWKNIVKILPGDWNTFFAYNTTWLTQIYRWGNLHTDFPLNNCYFGFCRLSDGPVGFLGKSMIRKIIRHLESMGLVCDNGCLWNAGIFT